MLTKNRFLHHSTKYILFLFTVFIFKSFYLFSRQPHLPKLLCKQLSASTSKTIKPNHTKIFKDLNKSLKKLRNSTILKLLNVLIFDSALIELLTPSGRPVIINSFMPSCKKPVSSLKILTANMLLFPQPFFDDQEERIKIFSTYARQLSPDLILLQEVWDNFSLALLNRLFYDYNCCFVPSALYNKSGLVIFSRHPIDKADFFRYRLSLHHNFEELIALKGYLAIKITINNRSAEVFNSHLYSAPLWVRHRPNFSQFIVLQNAVFKSSADICVLGGDMNLLPEEISTLKIDEIKTGNCLKPTAGGKKRTKKLDYIMLKTVKPEAFFETGRAITGEEFSDHSPVLGIIGIR